MSTQYTNKDPNLDKTLELAQWLANNYAKEDSKFLDQQHLTTLFLLIDLQTFVRCINKEEYDAGFKIMQELKFIPLVPNDVQGFVKAFDMVPDEVC